MSFKDFAWFILFWFWVGFILYVFWDLRKKMEDRRHDDDTF